MNKSLSRVSSTESLYQFQTTGVWLTTAIISLPNFWLVYCYCASSVVENVKHSLTSSIPLSDFFFPAEIFCLKADSRYMLFHQQTLAHSTQLLATAACERLAASAFTPQPLPFPAQTHCAIRSLKSHQGCNPETVLHFHPQLL